MPALYNLSLSGLLPEKFAIIVVDRVNETAESWVAQLHAALESYIDDPDAEFEIDEIDEAAWAQHTREVRYLSGNLEDREVYEQLHDLVGETDKACGTQGNGIFYLAVADGLFATVVEGLGAAGLTDRPDDRADADGWRRVVIEKPFGHDLASARDLNAKIRETLDERQIYRIDHFLGKDTVQSIMAFRFADGLFEPIWNRDRIDHVQVTAAETIGVEGRGAFYEAAGALRDMVPNHLFTILSMVAMEPPAGFGAEEVRNRKLELFSAMPAIPPYRVIRGQ